MKALIIFVCTFLTSFAVNMQTRNNVQNRYLMIGLTSMLIGGFNLMLLKLIPNITYVIEGLAYIVGGAAGSVFAVLMHKRFFN